MICDNGTNFKNGTRELSKIEDNKIYQQLVKHNIQWISNPPIGSHFAGSWDRQTRTIRKVLVQISREFGDMFDDASFYNVTCDVEVIINSRPLTITVKIVKTLKR